MNKKLTLLTIMSTFAFPVAAETPSSIINGMDFGPLAPLVGTWKSAPAGGVDVAPARPNTEAAKGSPVTSPFYEKTTIEVAADAVNVGEQNLVALYYKIEAFRKSDDVKFHDQRGYFIYDKANKTVYNDFCVPRNTCVTSEGPATAGKMVFTASKQGIAESNFMSKNASTTDYSMTIEIDGDNLMIMQDTKLHIYDKDFTHTDVSSLIRE